MIDTVLRTLTFGQFSLHQWRQVSLIHRLLSPLRQWRQGSSLLAYGDLIAAAIMAILLVLSPYTSTTLIGILLLACAALWFLLTVSDEANGWLTPIHLGVTLYWGTMVLATALSPVKAAAVSGLIKLTLNLLLFMLMARVLRQPKLRTGIVSVYVLATLPVAAYGMRQYFFGAEALATWVDPTTNLSGATRVYSYLGNPNLLAAYLMPAVAMSVSAFLVWPRWTPKLLAAIAFFLNLACLVLSYSRGGWIGLLGLFFVLTILLVYWWSELFPPFWKRWALPLLLGVMAGLVVFSALFVSPVRERVMTMFAWRGDSSNNFRINVWEGAMDMVRARPVLGIGPGNEAFNKIYPLYQRPNYTALSAYSIFLETLVEAGVIGFTAFLWMLGTTFYQGWQQLCRLRMDMDSQGYWLIGAIATCSGMLVHGLVDTVWYRPQVSTLWWLCMAIIASFYIPRRDYSQE
ncbi:bicarbonate family [Leptolyngbya sp. Heron Island J]|uniref:IctB family putative bicarbonate transporter n=1 Tax=Leptolyngbya sp. Heron Island J TaxID=1385935 RepID=UPI0003B9E769|nr:IctB family putative bicarbonate transporter [Leptolyngbya sp. Heron Island J]ESA37252.1 bicarbonate family [Leptolyngbya sp. Heron Island J]